MVAAADWSNLTVAGAFIVGAVLATVAYLRLTRHMIGMWHRDRRDGADDVIPPE
jgi:hypothetical protein